MIFPATPRRPDVVQPRIPPRADVPGRPDAPRRPDRRRRQRWIAPVAVASSLALVVLVVLVTLSFDGRPAAPPRAGSGSAFTSPDGAYAFLAMRFVDGRRVPVRWNPCEAIQYQVNLDGAPADALDEIRRATDRVTEATGIRFVYDGTTSRTMRQTSRDSFFSDLAGPSYYPVLIAWIPHDRMVHLTEKGVLAFAHPQDGGVDHYDQWASGWVIVDSDAPFEASGRYSLELVLTHELGHIVGLAHVSDPWELMFSDEEAPDSRPAQIYDWGVGDREGLELLGADQGCLDHISVTP